jgi:L-malate glycosyltransferase
MIRVMHVVDLPGPNHWLNGVAAHCDRSRFQHQVVSLRPRNGMHEELERRDVQTFSLQMTSRKQLPGAIFTLSALLKREAVDVVQTHTFDPTTVGLLAAKLARSRLTILTRHHANFSTLFDKPIHRKIDRWHALTADEVWSPSEFIRQCMVRHEGVPAGHITILPHGFDFELMKPQLGEAERRALRDEVGGDAHYLIGMVARLAIEKGHEYLLEAVPRVVARHPQARFVIIGDGPRRAELEAMAVERGIGDVVRFLGWRWDAWRLIEAMDLIAHPSLHEPFGIVYVESAALERAVVTTSDSAAPEIIDDGETGLIVPPRNATALAEALLTLAGDRARTRAMGQEARRRAIARFSFPTMMKAYEAGYDTGLARVNERRSPGNLLKRWIA